MPLHNTPGALGQCMVAAAMESTVRGGGRMESTVRGDGNGERGSPRGLLAIGTERQNTPRLMRVDGHADRALAARDDVDVGRVDGLRKSGG